MNAADILRNGHLTVLDATQGLSPSDWETPGVCGVWSVKEIIAHLASFERVLIDVLSSFLSDDPLPILERFISDFEAFNAAEVAWRRHRSPTEVLADYTEAHVTAAQLLDRIPVEMRQQNGTLPWYGEAYDLDDFIVYTGYGHKQEHCAQIAVFRDRLAHAAPVLEPDNFFVHSKSTRQEGQVHEPRR